MGEVREKGEGSAIGRNREEIRLTVGRKGRSEARREEKEPL